MRSEMRRIYLRLVLNFQQLCLQFAQSHTDFAGEYLAVASVTHPSSLKRNLYELYRSISRVPVICHVALQMEGATNLPGTS